ncbi:MAG: ABC-2 family transporter protein [Gemmatimonadota bacterium]|jgi:ABC-2 type transport system permease protein
MTARGLRRHAAILRAFWGANLAEELQYRANFFASLVGSAFWLAMAILTAAVFFRHTTTLGGWSFWEVVALLGVFTAVSGVVEAVLRPNVGALAQQVRDGSLDLVLSKPVDAQLWVSFRRLAFWRLTDVALGLGLCLLAVLRLDTAPGPAALLAFAVAGVSAVAIVYAVWLTLMTLAFWFVAVENLSVLFDAVYETARFPVAAYPGALRFLLTWLLPVAWMTTVPAAALTGRGGLGRTLVAAALAVLLLAASRLLWRRALGSYTSAGG